MSKIKTAGAIGLATALSAYCFVQNSMLVADIYTVKCKKLPESFEGVKILHLSDLHKKRYGDGFNNLINTCRFCDPTIYSLPRPVQQIRRKSYAKACADA